MSVPRPGSAHPGDFVVFARFDDAIYSAARMLEILDEHELAPLDVLEALPSWVATPELNIQMPEHLHRSFISRLVEVANFPGAKVNTIDGLRVDFPDSWGLVRASNTMPAIIVRFEGETENSLERIKALFRELLSKMNSIAGIKTIKILFKNIFFQEVFCLL